MLPFTNYTEQFLQRNNSVAVLCHFFIIVATVGSEARKKSLPQKTVLFNETNYYAHCITNELAGPIVVT